MLLYLRRWLWWLAMIIGVRILQDACCCQKLAETEGPLRSMALRTFWASARAVRRRVMRRGCNGSHVALCNSQFVDEQEMS
jgi:hypothetical protein